MNKRMAVLVASLLGGATVVARGQEPAQYLVRVTDPSTRRYHIEAELPASPGVTLVSLPAWTPGRYEIENYARYIRDFAAVSSSGAPLRWDKVDKDTWRIRCGDAARIRVRYDVVADTLSLSGSLLHDDFGVFNGTNLFVYPESGYDFPARLRFDLPDGWQIATELRETTQRGVYAVQDFHELVDNPTFLGHFGIDSALADGVWTRLAVYPAEYMERPAASMAMDALQRIADYAHDLFGPPPYERYTTLHYLYPGQPSFGGGLEHANSHFDISPAVLFEDSTLMPGFAFGLYSHEYYHAWNVKRIRPAEMWPYDYSREQYTPLLWVSEGLTSYYGPLILARTGLWTEEMFWENVASDMGAVEELPLTAVEDVSLSTWVSPFPVSSRYYYDKGAILGLLLDIKIRSATDNRNSLDDVMRRLYRDHFQRDRGFTTDDLLDYLAQYLGVDETRTFYEAYVDGREPLPYAEVLPRAGLAFRADTIVEPLLGVGLDYSDPDRLLVEFTSPGSAAMEAGLRAGDQLLRVGVVDVTEARAGWGNIFRRTYGDSIAVEIEIAFLRGEERMTGRGKLGTRTRIEYQVERLPDADAQQVAVRRGLIAGETR